MKSVCVLFGGKSSEFYVSCKSAYTIISNISKEKYDSILVGITQEGDWYLYEDDIQLIPSANWIEAERKYPASFITNSQFQGLTVFRDGNVEQIEVDVVFPVLHGKNGEDGTVQGLLDMIDISYVGCGLLSSAMSMDKSYTKLAVDKLGIKQAKYKLLMNKDSEEELLTKMTKAEKEFGYPLFVKPCKAGSSCGVSKAKNMEELKVAIEQAFRFDTKVLVEQAVYGRELECAILDIGSKDLIPSKVGEIKITADFYSYDAKYADATSITDTNPTLPDGVLERIQEAASRIFRVLDCRGLSRVDFFLENETNEIVFNEINTLPGFTDISMYPMLMRETGYSLPKLIELLIDSSF